jgi:Leucine-rich repeat (LRR) protein
MFPVWTHNKMYLKEYYRQSGNNVIITIENYLPSQYDQGIWPDVDTLIWKRTNQTLLSFLESNRFPNLERLECRDSGQNDLGFLSQCPELRRLDCSCNNLTSLEGIQYSPKVWILGCADNNLSNLNGIEALVNLNELHCDRNKVHELSPLQSLTNLWNLTTIGNPLL